MTIHETVLKRQEVVAKDTIALAFEKPAGFAFRAGQAIDLTLVNPPANDDKGVRRALSIVSAPHENEIVVATRVRDSAFKRGLKALRPGARVQIDGPFGALTLHSTRTRPAVFIAGGIGITPFISILRHASHEGRALRSMLVYSNGRPEDAAFLPELAQLANKPSGMFRLLPTMTKSLGAGSTWTGQRGRIDGVMLRSFVLPEHSNPVFYVAGPPAMVSGIRDVLGSLGIEDDDVRSEDFSGY